MKIALIGISCITLWLVTTVTFADMVYVTGTQTINLLSHARENANVLSTAKTGDALELIEDGKYYKKVKGPDGIVGWVINEELSFDPPAYLQLAALEKQHETLQQQFKQVQSESDAMHKTLQELQQQHEQLSEQNKKLQEQQQQTIVPTEHFWLLEIAMLIALFFVGYLFGIMKSRKKIRARFGGLDL